jgi:hypothetical protein
LYTTRFSVFAAAEPVNSRQRKRVADDARDQHGDLLAFLNADDDEKVRDSEEAEGDADEQGPQPPRLGVGGYAYGQDDDAEDEVNQYDRVNVHFLAPLGGLLLVV